MTRLLLTTDAVGGVWRYTVDLANGLVRRGIAAIVVTLGPPPDDTQRAELGAIPLVVTDLPLDWTARSAADLAEAATALSAIADAHGVSSLHLHEPSLLADMPAGGRPAVAVLHSCIASWWRAMSDQPLPDELEWRRARTQAGLLRADAVIVPSLSMVGMAAQLYRTPALRVVHNGLPMPPRVTTRRESMVLASGRLWDAAKNMATLDRAAAMIDAPVIAAGSAMSPNGESIALPALQLPGHLPSHRLAAELARAAVFCSLSRYEPFGLGVLEAAQAGCALVLSDNPTFRELWDGAALFVDPLDAAMVAARLRDALARPHPLGRAARSRAQRYSLEAMTEATLAVHRDAGALRAKAA